MAGMDNLIGSNLSLISQQDVRYDGILFSINAKESSIVLRDVKCFGTEDRVKEEYKKIPANPAVLAFVTFPGNEIKDLSVFETEDKPTTAPAPTPAPAPISKPQQSKPESFRQAVDRQESKAIEKSKSAAATQGSSTAAPRQPQNSAQGQRPQSQQQQGNAPQQKSYNNNNNQNQQNRKTNAPAAATTSTTDKEQSQHPKPQYSSAGSKPQSTAGTGEHLAKLRLKGADAVEAAEAVANLKSEFDFSAGLSTFNKDEVLAKVASETHGVSADGVEEKEQPKYVKDDFFDMLSNDSVGGGSGHSGMNRQEERVLNQDTFGAIAVQQSYQHRGHRGGGRGGGYRGGGRGVGRGSGSYGGGRGRGGYNNNRPASATATAAN